MNVSRELLMRYNDGAVSEEEDVQVEEEIEQETALLEDLEPYPELGIFMRAWAETRSEPKLDLSDDIMARIEALEPQPAPVKLAQVHSIWPRVATWLSLSAELAAGAMLVFRSWSAPHPHPSA